ncbi:MAG: bifunctional hydroxymethylpyrimidine kinase/phosphomethylpyrimidine kinase [Deltaproteobacteria bacterium]|nr:bifunctional hydroxymethylpyrimidine kinase/phosphomethylpyrimidine kinase [Deltaproteobacteria bacterium]
MKTVLIIAGSDPGAGAGLQQDLKVATLLGTYGLTVPTALTVQNSLGVQAVHPVAKDVVAAQLDAILGDFPVAAVKLGMLATKDIVTVVADRLQNLGPIPVVLDPVLAAGGGFPLLDETGITAMTDQLFPLTTLLTPNVPEAARLTGMKISSPADLEEAARRLQAGGPHWVLAKGGHLTAEPVDILTDGKNVYHLPGTRLTAPHQHGTGCLLASAAACYLAQGLALPEAVNQARQITREALKYGLPLGHGSGPVNPYAPFARDLARFAVLEDLRLAAARLQAEDISPLIPEVMTNLGFAAPYPEGPQDVAAFPGRLVKTPSGVIIPAGPAFGASRHVAAIILTALATHPELRSAMNIKFVTGIEDLASLLHLRAASFDRTEEPADVKRREGGTLAWSVASVLQPGKPAPDIIYDKGDLGKEAMIRILGASPMAVAEKALAIKNALQAG